MSDEATAAAAVVRSQSSWPQGDAAGNAMAHITTDLGDLSSIFDITDFDLDAIQQMDSEHFGEHVSNAQAAGEESTYMEGLGQSLHGSVSHDFADTGSIHGTPMTGDGSHYDANGAKFGAGQAYQGSAWQQFPSPQTQPFSMGIQDQYGVSAQIPPTPNSYEMHGEAGHFLQQQQQALFAQHKQLRNIENQLQGVQHQSHAHHPAHFTPMASPSGTPQYTMQPEFTTPGAYFSPLTSPALHAQLQPSHNQQVLQQAPGYFTNPSTAPSSNAPSPVDLNSGDVDMLDSAFTAETAGKKAKRKLVTPRSVAPTARVRQSPIQKPQKRKSGLLSSVIPALDNAIAEGQLHNKPTSATARISQTFDSSESGSISPEPLSEALMRPPPRPGTVMQSPVLNQHATHPYNAVDAAMSLSRKAAAATPKSILSMKPTRIDSPETTSLLATPTVNAVSQMSLDDLELPEAASKQPSRRTSVILRPGDDDGVLPLTTNIARKTPKLGPLSTPSSTRPESLSGDSPGVTSPASGSTPAALLKDKKTDGKSARSLKKRGSVGGSTSVMVSPALRPRISPSIKPLLPEGAALHSPTHALLLASKSNYQNLLEGNHLPGVNYPDSLSTGLTSKRTSHKVAEQGRRNRINEALKEMQSLIPSSNPLSKTSHDDYAPALREEEDSPDGGGADCDGKDGKESAAAKSNSSKAATVESANRYIRQLKESDMTQKAALLALKKENEEMRRKLAEATGCSDGEQNRSETSDMPPIQELDTTVNVE